MNRPFSPAARWSRLVPTALASVAVVLGVAAWSSARGAAPAPAAPVAIAVVNIERAFNSLAEYKALQKQFEADVAVKQKQIDEFAKSIEAKRKEVVEAPDRRAKSVKSLELLELDATTAARAKAIQQGANLEAGDRTRTIYLKIVATVEKIAQQDGYGLILMDDRSMEIPEVAGQAEMTGRISNRRILYADKKIDITDLLVQRMDNEYKAGGGK